MTEFEMIAKYFAPLTMGRVALDDDAAVLKIPDGQELVVSSDTLNAGVHFFGNSAAGDIARKALRVNLSDMAAMGAKPFCYQLNIAFPSKPDAEWLTEFCASLQDDQQRFHVFCSGGDTTSIQGGLSISITMMGLVDQGRAWRRGGAQAGDRLVLSGHVGDAWIGLEVLRGHLKTADDDYFVRAYYEPVPQFGIQAYGDCVRAAIDVSDGMIADLGHICSSSGVGARVDFSAILFSAQAQALIDAGQVDAMQLLNGGDDYQLLLAVASDAVIDGVQVIGEFVAGAGVVVVDGNGQDIPVRHTGWSHF